MNDNILYLFHHLHFEKSKDDIHHCGGGHRKIDSVVNYEINHCVCSQHSINREEAIGHSVDAELKSIEIKVKFLEKCPQGGWHIESGIKV